MTRINVGIRPHMLTDKHLLAEHREIKRIPNTIKSGKAQVDNIPKDFTLGKGHVKFFYDKILYLKIRYDLIYKECVARGFNIQHYYIAFDNIPQVLNNNWEPTKKDSKLIIERLIERDKHYKNIPKYKLRGSI